MPQASRTSFRPTLLALLLALSSQAGAQEELELAPGQEAVPDRAPAPEQEPAAEPEVDSTKEEAPAEEPATEEEKEARKPDQGVHLPVLLDAPSPDYPVEVTGRLEVQTVDVQLLVDREGKVTAAEVARSVGAPFDEAALRVARLYRFAPALRDGTAVAARIRVRVVFEPPPSAPLASALPASAPPPVVPLPVPDQEADVQQEPADPGPEEVLVYGEQAEEEKLAQSSDSVTVVDLAEKKKRASDMGEVLARTPGLVVRRAGGLGSDIRISLNGLYGRSVREFVDSVPLWMTAFPDNVGSLPVNLFDRLEVYRGVVPLRLAADALGGAINFVTDQQYETRAAGSFQAGSFDIYRGTLLAQYRQERSNFVARVLGYADSVDNDYPVDVEVTDDSGRLSPAQVPLFNNAYSAYGLTAEAGFVDKPWAERLLVRGFVSGTYNEIQYNQVMSVPYGEPWWKGESRGMAILYDNELGHGVSLSTTTNYAYRNAHIEDLGEHVYNWYGEQVRKRQTPGEITSQPLDQTVWRDAVFHRSLLEWQIVPEHVVLLSLTPLYSQQKGRDERWVADAPDPLSAESKVLNFISAVGYELNLLEMPGSPDDPKLRRRGTDFRLQNTLNFKSYLYHVDSTEALSAGGFRTHETESFDFGVGDGVRFAFTRWLFLKAAYEFARRLPDPLEIFGDGVLVSANLELVPEVSHNANFGPLLDWKGTPAGDIVAFANLAYRDSSNMIVLLGNLQYQTYRNVYRAKTWSGEGGLSWTSPREYVKLDWSATLNDSRNESESGPFAAFVGDPIPNRSPFGTSWAVQLSFDDIFTKGDRIEPYYQGRYTAGFFRSWESQGITEFKDRVEDQTAHDAGITYILDWPHARLTSTIEVQNLTDAALFDDFGVQRPGRAFYVKLVGEVF